MMVADVFALFDVQHFVDPLVEPFLLQAFFCIGLIPEDNESNTVVLPTCFLFVLLDARYQLIDPLLVVLLAIDFNLLAAQSLFSSYQNGLV